MASIGVQVGGRKVRNNASPSEAAYTRNINKQMDAIKRNLNKLISGIENANPQALHYAVQPIYQDSQRVVPEDTGTLKDSGFIETRRNASSATVVVGYAKGGHPHYAIYVHERLELEHDSPTQAKFLEDPIKWNMNKILPRYAEWMRAITK